MSVPWLDALTSVMLHESHKNWVIRPLGMLKDVISQCCSCGLLSGVCLGFSFHFSLLLPTFSLSFLLSSS